MKKRLLIIASVLIIISLLVAGVMYWLSLRKVTFIIEDYVDSVVVYDSSDKELRHFTTSEDTLLQAGDYYIIPEGENVATDKIQFVVDEGDKEILVNPAYSMEYLGGELEREKNAIEAAVAEKYPSLYPRYNLTHGTLYQRGEWFGGLLAPKVSDPRDEKDYYRIVLLKKDNQWQVIRRPEYILTSSRYSEVPIEILRQINQIVP